MFHAERRAVLLGLVAVTSAAVAPAAAAGAEEFAAAEFWTEQDGVKLWMFRKQLAANGGRRPVLFFAHGSTISARPSFDLEVPGAGEYSLMNVFARLGYDVWTMDFEGYGHSGRSAGNSDIATGARNLAAAAVVIERETGAAKFHIMGESSGALRAGRFAMDHPQRVDRLVLEAFTYTGKGSDTLGKRAERLAYFRANNRRVRTGSDIASIFTRDKPGTSDARVAPALAKAELPFGDSVPTGTYLDMTANLPQVDPKKVLSPVLLIRGEHDGIATEQDLMDFFVQLPSFDRQYVVLPGAAHSIAMGHSRAQFWHAMHAFLTQSQAQSA